MSSDEMLSVSEEMFMLFFSILYGIMLNSLIGMGAFPIAAALAGKDVVKRVKKDECVEELKWDKSNTTRYRLLFSLVLLNLCPLVYFAIAFQFLGALIDDLSVPHILFIGFLSLGVFAFYRFFLGLIVWKPCGNSLFYTKSEFSRLIAKRAIYESSWRHILVGVIYLIPWLVLVLSRVIWICF